MPLPQMATPSHAIVLFISYLSFITLANCQGYGYPAQNNHYQVPSPTARSEKSRYFHSDQRCIDDITTFNREEVVYVTLSKYGKVAGRISFLCDLPGVPERDRPQANYANSAYSSANLYPYQSRPIHRARIHANVSVFLGIPYAKAPTKENNRRFKDTISPDHWGSIDAFDFGPSCPQPSEFTGKYAKIEKVDEDCLYMNVYSPHIENPPRTKFPVMIYIHDGFFERGSGNVFPGHMLAASQEVVVVTFNYRLGPLGFFATGDNSSAGNFGMLDQVQAIKFVRENIHMFNGDPEQITLFGSGAGAASAGLLALSPLTSRFVKRVIASSGSPLAEWAVQRNFYLVQNNSIVASFRYGCTRQINSHKLVECLNSRSYNDFSLARVVPDVGWLAWAPVLDNRTRELGLQFLPQEPEHLISRLSPSFAYLTGVTRDDGASIFMDDPETRVLPDQRPDPGYFNRKIESYVRILNATRNPEAFLSALRFMYGPYYDSENTTLLRKGLIEMYSDSWYLTGVDKMAKELLKHNIRTYMYVLNYTITAFEPPDWRGVPHDTEYYLASGAPFMDPRWYPEKYNLERAKWSDADRNMSQFFMESWAKFARFGNPTPQALFNTILWRPMESKSLQYLSLNTTNYTSVMHLDYRQKYCQFWADYLPSLAMRSPVWWPYEFMPEQIELRFYRAGMWAVTAVLILLFFLTVLCSCLYCRAKRDRWGDAGAIDDYLPNIDKLSAQYSAPSTRANSETSLRSLSRSRDRVDFTPMVTTMPPTALKYSSSTTRRSSASPLDREAQQPLQSSASSHHHHHSQSRQPGHHPSAKNGRTNAGSSGSLNAKPLRGSPRPRPRSTGRNRYT